MTAVDRAGVRGPEPKAEHDGHRSRWHIRALRRCRAKTDHSRLVVGRIPLRGPSRRCGPEDVPELPRPACEHVPYGNTGGTRPGHREGAAGLTTHAPQAAQSVTLPASLDEAVAALAAMPAAVPVAGGTDLMAAVNSGLLRPTASGRSRPDQRDPRLAATRTATRCSAPDSPTRAWAVPTSPPSSRRSPPPRAPRDRRRSATRARSAATSPPPPPPATRCPCWPRWRPTWSSRARAAPAGRSPCRICWPAWTCCAPGELIGFVRVPLLHAPQVFLKATGRTGPGRATASVARRPRPGPARRALRGRRHRADAAAAAGGRAVDRLADRLGRRAAGWPGGADRLRGVRRRGLHPRPGAARGRGRLRSRCRPPYCTCGVPSPRWPDEHWGGRCRDTNDDRARQPGRRAATDDGRGPAAADSRRAAAVDDPAPRRVTTHDGATAVRQAPRGPASTPSRPHRRSTVRSPRRAARITCRRP